MKIPSPEEIESAIRIIENFVVFDRPIVKKAYKTALEVLSALKSGELVGKEEILTEDEIINVIEGYFHDYEVSECCAKELIKAQSNKVSKTKWENFPGPSHPTQDVKDMATKKDVARQSKYMSVEEVEKIVYDLLLKTGSSSYHLKDDSKALAQALTRLPKSELTREELVKIIFANSDPITCDPESDAVIYQNKFGDLADAILATRLPKGVGDKSPEEIVEEEFGKVTMSGNQYNQHIYHIERLRKALKEIIKLEYLGNDTDLVEVNKLLMRISTIAKTALEGGE
jgi:hypothetical protein